MPYSVNESVEGKLVKVEILQVIKPNEMLIKSKRTDLKFLPQLEKNIRMAWSENQKFTPKDMIPEKNTCVLVKDKTKWKGFRRGCIQHIHKGEDGVGFSVFLYDYGKKYLANVAHISKMLPEHAAIRPYMYLLTIQAVYPTDVDLGLPKWSTRALDFVNYFVSESDYPFGLKILTKPTTYHIVGDLFMLDEHGKRKYHSTLGEFLRAKKLAIDMKSYNKLLLLTSDINNLKKAAIPNIYNKTTGQILQFSPTLDPINGNAYLAKVSSKLKANSKSKQTSISSSGPRTSLSKYDPNKISKHGSYSFNAESVRKESSQYLHNLDKIILNMEKSDKK